MPKDGEEWGGGGGGLRHFSGVSKFAGKIDDAEFPVEIK